MSRLAEKSEKAQVMGDGSLQKSAILKKNGERRTFGVNIEGEKIEEMNNPGNHMELRPKLEGGVSQSYLREKLRRTGEWHSNGHNPIWFRSRFMRIRSSTHKTKGPTEPSLKNGTPDNKKGLAQRRLIGTTRLVISATDGSTINNQTKNKNTAE